MKQKLLSLLLSAFLLLSSALPVMAVGGMNTFEASLGTGAPYFNPYSDVSEDDWFAHSVELCHRMGFMRGWDGAFHPHGSLTVAEALTIAARVHQIYHEGSSTLLNGASVWYQPYADYCLDHKLCSADMFRSWEDCITRSQMAYVFSRVVPGIELGVLNEDLDFYPDMASPALYAEETLMLYRAGVLTGADEFGTFHPFQPITRSEAAAIITRVALPSERRMFHLLEPVVSLCSSAIVLALPQGFDTAVKQDGRQIVYINAGLGITCSVTATPYSYDGAQISDHMTHQELEDELTAQLEQDGDRLLYPPHTESDRFGKTEVCITYCDTDHSDGVSRYPVQLIRVQFILEGTLYEIEYRCIDDNYGPILNRMLMNLSINGVTLKQLWA